MNADSEIFVMHVTFQKRKEIFVDPGRKTQIKAQGGAQVRALLFDKAPTEIMAEYSDYSNVFSAKNTTELPENTGMNEHAIELEEDKQPPFGSIYSQGPVELETLKTYIKINLANNFIRFSKFPAGALILFN